MPHSLQPGEHNLGVGRATEVVTALFELAPQLAEIADFSVKNDDVTPGLFRASSKSPAIPHTYWVPVLAKSPGGINQPAGLWRDKGSAFML